MSAPFRLPPFAALSWNGALHPVALLCCFLIATASWLPPAWIEENANVLSYAEAVRETLLHVSRYADIGAHARTTQFPSASLFSHALTLTLIAAITLYDFLLVALHWSAWVDHWERSVSGPGSGKTRAILTLSGLFALVITWAATMMPGSLDHMASADLRSRAVLGLLSVLVFICWHMAAFLYAVMFFAVVLPSRKKELS